METSKDPLTGCWLLIFGVLRAYVAGMDFLDFPAAIFVGNIMTLSFVWGCVQFHRHDYEAPWLAYAAFLLPLAYVGMTFIAEGQLSLPAALAPQ